MVEYLNVGREILGRWGRKFTYQQLAVNSSIAMLWPLVILVIIGFAQQHGDGFPPQLMAFLRLLVNGMVLIHIALASHLNHLLNGIWRMIMEYRNGGIEYGSDVRQREE